MPSRITTRLPFTDRWRGFVGMAGSQYVLEIDLKVDEGGCGLGLLL